MEPPTHNQSPSSSSNHYIDFYGHCFLAFLYGFTLIIIFYCYEFGILLKFMEWKEILCILWCLAPSALCLWDLSICCMLIFIVMQCSIIWIFHNSFIHSTVGECLHYFWFGSLWTFMYMSFDELTYIFLKYLYSGVLLFSHQFIYSILANIASFPKYLYQFTVLSALPKSYFCSHSHWHLVLSTFPSFRHYENIWWPVLIIIIFNAPHNS